MSKKNDQNGENNDLKPPIEPEFQAADQASDRIERILAEISQGWKLTLSRLQPGWCRGHLETIVYSDSDPLSLDYLVQQWGGDIIRVQAKDPGGKIRATVEVPLLSHPPRRFGKLLKYGQTADGGDDDATNAPKNNTLGNIEQILSVVEKLRAADRPTTAIAASAAPAPDSSTALLELVKFLLKQQMVQQQAAYAPPPAQNGLAQIMEAAKAYQQLKILFGDNDEGGKSVDGESNLMDGIKSILDTYLKIKSAEKQKAPALTVVRNLPTPIGSAAPKENPADPNAPAAPPTDIISAMRSADAKTIANTFLSAVGAMPEGKRQEIFTTIFRELGIEDEDDQDEDDQGDDAADPTNPDSIVDNT